MASGQSYCVRYEGNNSKRWDGKEIWIEATVLEELYEPYQLTSGSHASILAELAIGMLSLLIHMQLSNVVGTLKMLHCFYKYIHACN